MRDELGPRLQRTRTRCDDLPANGRRRPPFAPAEAKRIVETITTTAPQTHDLPGRGWTLKKLQHWVSQRLLRTVSRSTLHKTLQAARLSWKKCKKWLGKRDPHKRAAFLDRFVNVYEQVMKQEIVLLYLDESHFHRDLEIGYSWGPVGQRLWCPSDCPGLAERINWYGAYNFSDGQCFIWAEGACNKENTAEFLHRVEEWVRKSGRRLVVVWDGAPWHKAKLVEQAAHDLEIELMPLPGYSPDLNPIEGLWKWMRQDVTQLCCHPSLKALFDACKAFVDRINTSPLELVSRLWPKFELDPEQEKLRLST
jgi:transposase